MLHRDVQSRISEDQNTLKDEKWGELHFFESLYGCCGKCLVSLVDCSSVPCTPIQRKDHKNGYFSIHEMSEEGVRKC